MAFYRSEKGDFLGRWCSRDRFGGRFRRSLRKFRDQRLQFWFFDQRNGFGRFDPLGDPLLGLRPSFALPADEQGKDFYLAGYDVALLVEQLVVGEEAEGFRADLAAHAGFLECFSGG